MCCNINLVKPFGNYALLNTRSTAKNLRSRREHTLSAWNQYYRPSCMSYTCSIESQSYIDMIEDKNYHTKLLFVNLTQSYVSEQKRKQQDNDNYVIRTS